MVAHRIGAMIAIEHQTAEEWVLRVTGQQKLLQENPDLDRSMAWRDTFLGPLNYIQVALLKRLRREKGAAGGAAVWVGCGGCARGTGPREARGLDSVCAGGNPAAAAGGGILCGWGGGGFHFVAGWGVSEVGSVSPCSAIEGRAGMPLSPALSPLVPRGEREMEQSGGQGASGRSAQVGCAYGAAVAG